ncbi:Hypothetical predicted protein [Marmota monax]|uniref:Uncharacterized protein n=1 Tax=Marmota monax TaxID=9995 RepID=A0A5E4D891_MARMO|nr:hypothetical protein GHT09_016426 [Marmota monax]VTJ89019.1 Hypothetical predicted protein [Marmota monax]
MGERTEKQVSALIPISLPSSKDMEGRCSRSLLCCLASLLLLVQLSTEQFQVVGLRHPIVALPGEDAIVPYALVPAMNAENMELGWFHTTFSQAVFIYWNQWEQTEKHMAEYRGRTSLVRDILTEG